MGGEPDDSFRLPRRRPHGRDGLGPLALGLGIAVIGGCRSPLAPPKDLSELGPGLQAAIDREIASMGEETPTLETASVPSEVVEELADRREELDALGPATETNRTPFSLGADLSGEEQQVVRIGLDEAVTNGVANNLSLRIANLQPAVNRQDVDIANAAFDFVLFANADLVWTDQPQPAFTLGGVVLGTPFNTTQSYRFETGVSKRFQSGGELVVSTDLDRFRNQSPGIGLSPDPAYTGAVRLGYVQPLLRGFGADVNTATIRIASNVESDAVAQLVGDLLVLVDEIEAAYWDLLFSWRELEIRQWLVNVGETVRNNLGQRRDFDTTPAEYSDAVARVEARRANVIRSRRSLRSASDRLKVLMNDRELTIGSEAVLKPAERFLDTPIDYNFRAMVLTAIGNRPDVLQAALAIDNSAVGQMLAGNALLPQLDLAAQVAWFGQDDNAGTAYGNLFDGDFVDYVLGLGFEQPIGNRAAEANYRRARLERAQSMIGYQRTVQDVVLDVKAALRNVITTYELIEATRSFRIAQAENLRTLEAEEPLRGLTPEFLNLKFQRQEGLAEARAEEFLSLSNFNQSISSLYRAMGTGLRMRGIDLEMVGSPRDAELAPR